MVVSVLESKEKQVSFSKGSGRSSDSLFVLCVFPAYSTYGHKDRHLLRARETSRSQLVPPRKQRANSVVGNTIEEKQV